MERRLTEALDDTLASLARGESRETCLARYPESARELAALIDTREQLKVLSHMPPLAASQAAVRRRQFLSAARATARRPEPVKPLQRLLGRILPPGGQEHAVWIPTLVRAAVALLIVLGSMGGTAAVAQSSFPDSPLYGLKLAIEDVRLSLTGDPSRQVALNLAFAADRAREIQRMAASDRAISPNVQRRLRAELDAALRSADGAGEEDAPRLLEQIRLTMQTQEQSLAQAQLHASEGGRVSLRLAQQAMTRARIEAESALGDPSRLRYRHHLGVPSESAAMPTGEPHTPTPTGRAIATHQPAWTPQATVTPEMALTPQHMGIDASQRPTSASGAQATTEAGQTEPVAQPTPGQDGPTSQPSQGRSDREGSGGNGGADSGGGTGDEGSGSGSDGPDSGGGTGDGGSGSGSDSPDSGGGHRRP